MPELSPQGGEAGWLELSRREVFEEQEGELQFAAQRACLRGIISRLGWGMS